MRRSRAVDAARAGAVLLCVCFSNKLSTAYCERCCLPVVVHPQTSLLVSLSLSLSLSLSALGTDFSVQSLPFILWGQLKLSVHFEHKILIMNAGLFVILWVVSVIHSFSWFQWVPNLFFFVIQFFWCRCTYRHTGDVVMIFWEEIAKCVST